MRQGQDMIFQRLAMALRAHADDITQEPLPRRWVELINFLDEQEQKLAEVQQAEKNLRGE
jgi:hypothetical protein